MHLRNCATCIMMARMICWHVWRGLSRRMNPVIGVSTCTRCGHVADIADWMRARHWALARAVETLAQGRGLATAAGNSE